MSSLPRMYQGSGYQDREREVALFIDGAYVTRGAASAARIPALHGWRGWNETVPPARLSFVLDRCGWSEDPARDRPDLCWGGARLTSAEFLTWLDGEG